MPAPPALLRRIAAMGIAATEHHWSLIPADLARRAHPRVERVGDALLTLIRASDSLRLNRVIGLGHQGAARESTVDAIVERYRRAGIERFSLLLGPGPQLERIPSWLERRGFTRHGGYTLLLRDCRAPIPRPRAQLRVARVTRTHREDAVAIVAESFAVPASRRAWSLAAAADRGNQTFLAFVGRHPVAVGTLRTRDGLAWLGGAATRTRWRRHGAQTAIIAARLRRASLLGCRWAWSETVAPQAGRPDGSRRNLMRLGFEQVCIEPIYIWNA